MVHIRIIICTYNREKQLRKNLDKFQKSRFFMPGDELYGKMSIIVVDNASALCEISGEQIRLVHNQNTGGSGGFARGMSETVRDEKKYGITHAVLMDDDVDIIMETFYRLYALLLLMKDEYRGEVIAGRMFDSTQTHIQHTAAERWNGGEVCHIGGGLDMRLAKNLDSVNDSFEADYSGWWFACFPIDFIRKNKPLPFFLHCDDVEYGLRHGGSPIILNGIQVWHEVPENRQLPLMKYYDMRNSMIVNSLFGLTPDCGEVIEKWKKKITEYHVKKDYLSEHMLILGLFDYCRGMKWFMSRDTEKENIKLRRKRHFIRYRNAVLWRITERRYSRRFKGYEKQ